MIVKQQSDIEIPSEATPDFSDIEGSCSLFHWRCSVVVFVVVVLLALAHWQLNYLESGIIASLLTITMTVLAIWYRRRDVTQAREYAAALRSLSEVSAAISGRLPTATDPLDDLLRAVSAQLNCSIAMLCIRDPSGAGGRLVTSVGLHPPLRDIYIPPEELRVAQYIFDGGGPVLVNEVRKSKVPMNRAWLDKAGIRAFLSLPLRIERKTVGVLSIADREPHRFGKAELQLAELWAAQAAVILANARLYAEKDAALFRLEKLIRQREAIYAMIASIYQSSSLNESLESIVQLVPMALEVDICTVSLLNETGDILTIAHCTRSYPPVIGSTIVVKGSNAERVFVSRQILAIEDTNKDHSIQQRFKILHNIGSALYAPLIGTGDQRLGLITLVRNQPGVFTPDQRAMARLFAARVSEAFETTRLHEQTRADAETKAMLLRELNHRVKNNLANIVGVLSMETAEMSHEARRGLRRVIDRVTMMARAHELFTGGVKAVGLSELIGQVIGSISLARTARVRIQSQVPGDLVRLATGRAVSLAMVMHELGYNALVHGIGPIGSGTVTFTAKLLEPIESEFPSARRRLVLQVIDQREAQDESLSRSFDESPLSSRFDSDGDQTSAVAVIEEEESTAPLLGRTGIGLSLVKGIVGRELRGTFSLTPGVGGGSVATVEFVVSPGEWDIDGANEVGGISGGV